MDLRVIPHRAIQKANFAALRWKISPKKDNPFFHLFLLLFHRRFFSFWAPGSESSGISKFLYFLYNKIMFAIIFTYTGTVIADLCENYRDLVMATDDGCYIVGALIVIFKLINFQLRRDRIEHLMNRIYEPVRMLLRSSDKAVVTLVKSFVLYEMGTVFILWSIGAFLIAASVIFPPTENGSLPIRAKYPFDSRVSPMHEVAFSIEATALTSIVTAIWVMDIVVMGFCRYTILQLQILGSNYMNCRNSLSERGYLRLPESSLATSFISAEDDFVIRTFVPFCSEESTESEDSFDKRFKTCVKHHHRLIRIVDDINELFSSGMLVQLCASTSMICLVAFQAVLGANENSSFAQYAVFFGSVFCQLWCWCWFGNALIYESDSLATSQWFSGWEDEKDISSVASLITMSLIRTRRPMGLAAGSFYTMSLGMFITILKSSYSIFALLTAVNDEP
ncbi:odorant receptor 83a-like [Venturia canescens]|uniref:odorant receptor 83a-like n=1 Tax=Venturia canescens TaxID=32260 RepID=UPI001C9D5FF1|nr:odorant receptor 83a-like [Venturia canescens]